MNEQHILSWITTLCLFTLVSIHVSIFTVLYADGANYMLHILKDMNFFHVSTTRISATFITQLPLLLALKGGIDSLTILARVYNASLIGLPVLGYVLSAWIVRKDLVLSVGTAVVVAVCLFMTSFHIIGEYHVLHSYFWLGFVILISGACYRMSWTMALLLTGLVLIKSYETSLVFCSLLSMLCIWRALGAPRSYARWLLLLAACLFAGGAWFGLLGMLYPRDPENLAGFGEAAQRIWENPVLPQFAALTSLTAVAVFIPGRNLKRDVALVVAAALLLLVRQQVQPTEAFGLGSPTDQRAQVPVVMLAVALISMAARKLAPSLSKASPTDATFMALPLAAALTISTVDALDWRDFLRSVCAELNTPPASDGADGASFFSGRLVEKMGYPWEYPTLSVLLRAPGSDRMLIHPGYTGWLPFDPAMQTPDISAFQTGHQGICSRLTQDVARGLP
jgi:hypothetical protein